MEIAYFKLACVGQVLVVWLPMVLAICREDLNTLTLGDMQKFPNTKKNMYDSCADLINRDTEECSVDCDTNVQKMVDLYRGSLIFFTCNCSDTLPIYPESECLKVQERLAVCPSLVSGHPAQTTSPGTGTAPASTTPTILQDGKVPCEAAHRRCSKSPNCVSQLHATISACEGAGCDAVCQRALDTLLVQRDAQDLWQCTGCDDDSEDGWCDLSKRCTVVQSEATVVPYKPEDTAKTSSHTGMVRSSPNNANPSCSFLLSQIELILIYVILIIAFF